MSDVLPVRQHGRQQIGARGSAGAQPDAPGDLGRMRGHGLLGLRQRGIDNADMGQQFPPRGGRAGAAAAALDQRYAEAPLQLADLQADGGLGHTAALGGSGKTA
ncbi:hypothetical protein G6F58_013280 [Rhizopus delemar]|nr:hypothetical protein G6F58_013280 [Rhizopus delemar]